MAGPIWAKWVNILQIRLLSLIRATMVTKSSATWLERRNFLTSMNDALPINRGYPCTCGTNARNKQPPQFRNSLVWVLLSFGGAMAIFESLVNALRALAVGDRVKVTVRPETGRFPNPMEGHITQKDDSGNFVLKSEQGVIQISASDILSITKL